MLCTVNAFLLVLVLVREWKSVQVTETAREQVIEVFQRNGIQVDRDVLPKDAHRTAMTVTRDPEAETRQAAALLGELVPADDSTTVYQGADGSEAQFYPNGEWSASFPPGKYPLNGDTPSALALRVMEAMGLEAQVVSAPESGASVTVCQVWDGLPVFTCQATFHFEGGELRSVRDGRRLIGTPQSEGGTESMTVTTALLRFLDYIKSHGDICNQITGFYAGYTLDTTQIDPARLTPTWSLTTNAGSGVRAYYIDALTGDVRGETA